MGVNIAYSAGVSGTPLQSGGADVVETAVALLLIGVIAAPICLGLRQTFLKAGRAGWKALVPGYNVVVARRVIGYTSVWALPTLGTLATQYARCFGRGKKFGYGILLFPVVFLPVLGYGSAEYQGPVVDEAETRRLIDKHKRDVRRGAKMGFTAVFGMVSAVSNVRYWWIPFLRERETVDRRSKDGEQSGASPEARQGGPEQREREREA